MEENFIYQNAHKIAHSISIGLRQQQAEDIKIKVAALSRNTKRLFLICLAKIKVVCVCHIVIIVSCKWVMGFERWCFCCFFLFFFLKGASARKWYGQIQYIHCNRFNETHFNCIENYSKCIIRVFVYGPKRAHVCVCVYVDYRVCCANAQ